MTLATRLSSRSNEYRMDSENLALAQEEATLTKIRTVLNSQGVKLWEPPYYDTEKKIPNEPSLHELAVALCGEVNLPRPHIFQGLQMLQQNALEKLAARQRYVHFYVFYYFYLIKLMY